MVRYAYRDARRYAEQQGYVLKGTEKIWDSSIANIGILWTVDNARDRLPAYLEAVYPPFWRRELDIEDVSVVEACLKQAGVPVEGFADFQSNAGRNRHDALQASFHPNGIYGVPSYVFDGTILFGREHLPYIRWYLAGRNGPAPDIANAPDDPCHVDIFIDFKSPAAYLALKPTLALLQEENIEARFRPFRVRERDVPQIAEHETVGDTHRRVRAQSSAISFCIMPRCKVLR